MSRSETESEIEEVIIMTIKQTAITLVRANEIFKDFFKRNPDMSNMDDVTELLAIQCDICYAMQNVKMRNEKAD